MKYSDVVVLVRKSPDGAITRTNAVVLSSAVSDGKTLKGRTGLLPVGEYLDLAFPRPLINDQLLKTRSFSDIFAPAWEVARWKDGASIGWEPGSATAVAPVPQPPHLPTDHSRMKLGKAKAKLDSRTLRFAAYIPAALPTAPPTLDWSMGKKDFGMLGNDSLGDCTIAAAIHVEEIVSMNVDAELPFTTQDAISYYSKWAGYKPGKPNTDNGAVELDILNSWRKDKLNGHALLAYAALDPANMDHVRLSVALLGNSYIGIQLPISAQTQNTWDVAGPLDSPNNQPGSWGGHAVPVVGYDATGVWVITWGILKKMTWAFWTAYVDEAYALVVGYWFRNGAAPSAKLFGDVSGDELFRLNDLLSDATQLAG